MFVRRVLIWVIGHSLAPWLPDQGINASLLLSAVEHDLYGAQSKSRSRIYDYEYLRDLCGCLLAFRTASDRRSLTPVQDNFPGLEKVTNEPDTEFFVSLAHYTVMEFLESPYIRATSVSYFALPQDLIESEFGTSVLQQALAASPQGTETDWIYDREAYCLTLGCALNRRAHLANVETGGLFIQYLTPSSPHFSRFRAIQERIAHDKEASDIYYLRHLPAQILHNSASDMHGNSAETLMNILLLPDSWPLGLKTLPLVQRLVVSSGTDIRDLLRTKISGITIDAGWGPSEESPAGMLPEIAFQTFEVKFSGTVWSIVSRSYGLDGAEDGTFEDMVKLVQHGS